MSRFCKSCDPTHLDRPQELFVELDRRRLLVPGPDLVVVLTNVDERVLGTSPYEGSLDEDWEGRSAINAVVAAGGIETWVRGPRQKSAYVIRRRLGRTTPITTDLVPLPRTFAS